MLLLIDLTSYTTNMKNKILKKQLYIIKRKQKQKLTSIKIMFLTVVHGENLLEVLEV